MALIVDPLDAAGITDPELRAAYTRCRALNAEHGKTYFLATFLLPPAKRPYVWALYGFARYADEFVDSLTDPDPGQLLVWGQRFLDSLQHGSPDEPVGLAMADTMRRWDIPTEQVEVFLESMRMDITVSGYPTYADLERYMYGSAAVIGLQMLPILEPHHPQAPARARALGEAFQLTNFIRDVGEDLRRGRVYLPQEDLDAFGVDREMLAGGVVSPPVRELLRFEVERTQALYEFAEPGIAMVHPTSQDCLRTAFELYRGILHEVERADYQVLRQRVSVPVSTRLRVAVPRLRAARAARRREQHAHQPA